MFRSRAFILTAMIVAAGCQYDRDPDLAPHGPVSDAHQPINTAIVNAYHANAIDRAIISQATVYPYHFVAYSASLNDLGQRDVRVLARHFARHPGPLHVRAGDESIGLYEQRVQSVIDVLVDGGVDLDKIQVDDGLPGGPGLGSDDVVVMFEKMRSDATADDVADASGFSTTTGGMSEENQ